MAKGKQLTSCAWQSVFPLTLCLCLTMGIEYSTEDHQDVPVTGGKIVIIMLLSIITSRSTKESGGSKELRKVHQERYGHLKTERKWAQLQVSLYSNYQIRILHNIYFLVLLTLKGTHILIFNPQTWWMGPSRCWIPRARPLPAAGRRGLVLARWQTSLSKMDGPKKEKVNQNLKVQ